MRRRYYLVFLLLPLLCIGAAASLYLLTQVSERADWYAHTFRTSIYRVFFPPEEVRFVPQAEIDQIVRETLQAWTLTPTDPQPSLSATPLPTGTPLPTETPIPTTPPTPTATLPPASVRLSGFRNEVETRNNCGPATLAMALSYWGWQGDQTTTRAVLRPNLKVDDKNVMPAELVNYVHAHTGLRALVRVGGDLELLKRLIAAGFPVIVEKGHITTGWIGHYVLLSGYDEQPGHFLAQDSLIKTPDTPVPYAGLKEPWWRHFNYLYLVIYPPEREAEVLGILGPHADLSFNFQAAAQIAQEETASASGRELFFAWYNLGSSLVGLGDYEGAAQAFDRAYGEVYPQLERAERPWRVPWYQTDVYAAYYHTGRYQDVINLAEATLVATGSAVLEETFYWRGLAREALGDPAGAQADFRKAVELNPNSTPARDKINADG